MSTRNTPKDKSPKSPKTDKKINPTPPDDQPQREDEYLSKFLKDSNPESDKKTEKDKK